MSAAGSAAGFSLFRPEALEAQRQALLGRVPIIPLLAHWSCARRATDGCGSGLIK